MKVRLLATLVLAARCVFAGEDAAIARVSVADLLDPAKRMAALQAYVVRAEPERTRILEWHDPAKFAAGHPGLQVQKISAAVPDGARVLVTFSGNPYGADESSAWPAGSMAAAFASKRGDLLLPFQLISYYRFNIDGRALGGPSPEMCSTANVGDFNQDGSVDLLEYTGDNGLTGGTTSSSDDLNVSYAVIRPAGYDTKPVFAVLYGMHPEDRVEVAPWGGQLVDEDGDGIFEFQIGPRTDGQIKPKVTFRWDAALGTWVGPEEKPRAHYRVLQLANVPADIQRIAKGGGLDCPMEFKSKEEAENERAETLFDIEKGLTADKVSKPYHHASLAALGNEQILDWMIRRRTVWDVARERMNAAANVADLWQTDPKAAALAYLHGHRPPSARTNFRYAFDDLDGQPAPDVGTVTVSDGPSGCFAPSGAFVHFLHCAPGDSYLVFAGSLGRSEAGPLRQQHAFDFRKVPLSDTEARQALHIVWWLSRIRAQWLGERNGRGGMGSTSDGWATVQVQTKKRQIRIEGMRFAGHQGASVAIGETSDDYDKTAFLNLVVYFFNHDFVTHLGTRWAKSDPFERTLAQPDRDLNSAIERERVSRLSAEWVRMFLRRLLPPAVASVALEAVGELGLKELRAEVGRMAEILPPPSPAERQLKELDAAVTTWKKAHGAQGTDFGEIDGRKKAREATEGTPNHRPPPPFPGSGPLSPPLGENADPIPTAPPPAIPGLESLPGEKEDATPPPDDAVAPVKEILARFAKFDALFAKRESISEKQSSTDKEIATLRENIARTLRKLDSWDNGRALERWALEDEMGFYYAGTRLAQVDRKRALGVLRHYATSSTSEADRDRYQAWLDDEPGITPTNTATRLARKAALSRADVDALLKILNDAKSSIRDRENALQAIVPPAEPGKYPFPEIDDALLNGEILKAEGSYLLDEIARSLALRLGSKAWDRLVELSALKGTADIPEFHIVVPALTILSQREPALLREPLTRLLEPQLTESNGDLEKVFWSAWRAELRALKPALERVATSSPDDAEGEWTHTYSNHRSPVSDRYHLARQIVSIWNEEDAATRAKLLIAFGTAYPREVMDNDAEPMRAHLQAVATLLDGEQRATVLAIIAKMPVSSPSQSSNEKDSRAAFAKLARAVLDRH